MFHVYGEASPCLLRFDQSSRFYAATLAQGKGVVNWAAFQTSAVSVSTVGGGPLQPSTSRIDSDSEPETLDRDYSEDVTAPPPPPGPVPATQTQAAEIGRIVDGLAAKLKSAALKVTLPLSINRSMSLSVSPKPTSIRYGPTSTLSRARSPTSKHPVNWSTLLEPRSWLR